MYRSPFTILPLAAPIDGTALSRSELQLERRKLMAEFELQGADSIVLNGHELHRQDVVTLFDELKDKRMLAMHIAIRNEPALLRFLEEGTFQTGSNWRSEPFRDFLPQISPLFAAAQNAYFKAILEGREPIEPFYYYTTQPYLVMAEDDELAYRYSSRFFIDKKNTLMGMRQRSADGEAIHRKEIENWATPAQIVVLNSLPDTFSNMRYSIADALNDLCVHYDRTNAPRHALAAIEAASKVHVTDGELGSLIPKNRDIIREKQPGFFKGWQRSFWWGLVIAVAVLRNTIFSSSYDDTTTGDRIQNLLEYQRQHPVSFETTALLKTYKSVIDAANTTSANAPDDRFASVFKLTKPTRPGDDPFWRVFSGANLPDSLVGDSLTTGLTLENNSRWDVILIYLLDENRAKSMYVPSGSCYTARFFASQPLVVNMYAGKGWDDSVRHYFSDYSSAFMSKASVLQGGFAERPVNLTECGTGAAPMLETINAAGVFPNRISVQNDPADSMRIKKEFIIQQTDLSQGPCR